MVAESWMLKKMGNQVSQNFKIAIQLEQSSSSKKNLAKKHDDQKHLKKQIIGILSFEVANVMSKTIHLHNSLTNQEVFKLKNEIFKSESVERLVSSNESYLLELALSEKLDDLNRVANVVSRLGKKCVEPALHGFEHVYGDLVNGVIGIDELGFLVKDMESMVKKMEKYVNVTSNLYTEIEVLNELEHASKKFQLNQHEESRCAFEQKLIWQKQDVRHLKDVSLWNQTYDKAVELLARTVCTIYARICLVFGEPVSKRVNLIFSDENSSLLNANSRQVSGKIDVRNYDKKVLRPLKPALSKCSSHHSRSIEKVTTEKKKIVVKSRHDLRRSEIAMFQPEDFIVPCGTNPGRLFMDCLSLSSSSSKVDDDDDDNISSHNATYSQISGCLSNPISRKGFEMSSSFNRTSNNSSRFNPKTRLPLQAPLSTIGGSALALHYANVIIIIEKFLRYPHLVGEEARDDLYQMLPTSLRISLKTNLKLYIKNVAIYDAPLAHDWKANLDGILLWLAPLAHNMIRWQSERNFEQHQIVTRTNVLLLQTLYFADREKTEAAICEILVGLNYICRYEHQQNALLDCASSFNFEDYMEMRSSHLH